MKDEQLNSTVWALWNIQESLLQNYRSIFISSESILLSLSITILSLGNPLFALLLAIPGLFLHFLWRAICSARGRDVSFSQRLIEKVESQEIKNINVLIEFKRYQKEFDNSGYPDGYVLGNWKLNEDEVFANMQLSKTRVKMDKYLPNTYAVLWFFVIGIYLYKLFLT